MYYNDEDREARKERLVKKYGQKTNEFVDLCDEQKYDEAIKYLRKSLLSPVIFEIVFPSSIRLWIVVSIFFLFFKFLFNLKIIADAVLDIGLIIQICLILGGLFFYTIGANIIITKMKKMDEDEENKDDITL